MGGKKKRAICKECSKAKFPAISAAKLGHENCLVTAYRVLGVFNERDSYGATPIHYAARNGQLECLQWLVAHSGISPVVAAKNGTTAAHDSSAMGHLLCLQFLLEKTKCSPQDRTNEGATVLHMACRFGHVGVTRWLIEKGLSAPSEKGDNGVTPVHLCAAKNHLECLKYLTRCSKYLPNELTVHGATPVYFAAQEGSLECLEWLVKHSEGDPSIFANDGMGAVHAAAQAGEIECLKWLIRHGGVSATQKAEDGATPMHFAAAGGQMLCLKWLVDNGGSLMDKDDLGGTPLHDAAEQGQTEAVSFILGCGVQKDIPDNDGYTPIDLAKDNNHLECMKLFYIKTPNLLNSLAPQQPQNRASTSEEEMLRREKQKKFEKALLSTTTEQERKDIWNKAVENVPMPKQLLTIPASSDNVSHGSSRKSRHRDSQDEHRSSHISLIADLVDDYVGKDRPLLSPELFVNPNEQDSQKEEQQGTGDKLVVKVEMEVETDEEDGLKEDEQRKYDEPKFKELKMEVDSDENDLAEEDVIKSLQNDPAEEGVVEGLHFAARNNALDNEDLTTVDTVDEKTPYDEFHLASSRKEEVVSVEPSSIHTARISESKGMQSSPQKSLDSSTASSSSKPSRWKGLLSRLSLKKSKKPAPKGEKIFNNHEQSGHETKVILRQKTSMTASKSADQEVFSHRTSKGEELAIVTHKRSSTTDDDEVAVKFEKRQLRAARQSTLSAVDNMSSPESSEDEADKQLGEESDEDIFRPLTKTGFDRFGKPISKEGIVLEGETREWSDDGLLLEERGSLASLDTMVIHENEEVGSCESKETSTIDANEKNAPCSATNMVGHSVPQPLKVAKVCMYNEPLVKSSPSPKRDRKRLMLVSSIEEENEDEETEDSLSPLPDIQQTTSSKDQVENRLKLDGIEGPDLNKSNMPVKQHTFATNSQTSSVPAFLPKSSGMRSFALVKQMYATSNSSPNNVSIGLHRGQNRSSTQVYSPLMVVATASPRVSLSSVKEEQVDEELKEGKESEQCVSSTPATADPENQDSKNRVSLTPSQEAAFENLEKLKDSLNDLEKKESKVLEERDIVNHKEAMRTSPAVEELFDMIKDLDDMIMTKNQTDGSSSEEVSLTSLEIQTLVSTPKQTTKNDAHDKIIKEITVNVEIDGVGSIPVVVKKTSLVISLMFKAAESAGIMLNSNHALFEVHSLLRIERPLEDHERIIEIISRWPKKNPPHFHLHTHYEKYQLWEDNPLPKGYVGQFLKQGKIPNISSSLHYCRGGGGRGIKWSKGTHCLGSLGIYLINTSKESSNMDLVCATDQLLFLPVSTETGEFAASKFNKSLPSKHCFVMKPVNSWKDKELKIFCCEDYRSYCQWISGIRLVKYGLQLKCNYVAMKKRLNQGALASSPPAAVTDSYSNTRE